MMSSVRFGDTFKVVSPARPLDEAEAAYRAELDAKKAKGGYVSDWDYKNLAENRDKVLQDKSDYVALYGAYAAQDQAGLTLPKVD